jgi:hypothetical protein
MSDITNDSIILNDILSQRLNANRIDLLDINFFGEIVFKFENGMVKDYEIKKRRRVKR